MSDVIERHGQTINELHDRLRKIRERSPGPQFEIENEIYREIKKHEDAIERIKLGRLVREAERVVRQRIMDDRTLIHTPGLSRFGGGDK